MQKKQATLEERIDRGLQARKAVKRGAHDHTGKCDRDPILLLQANSEGRVARLIPLRYARMLTSPFAFFRGSAILQAHDLSGTPDSGIYFQICGDSHLSNFGGFATPERNLIFDVNDFDETHPGPWEWDLKRLCASFGVAGRHLGHGDPAAEEMAYTAARTYQQYMTEYSQMGELEVWYEQITFERLLEQSRTSEGRKLVKDGIAKADRRSSEELLPKLGVLENGQWKIRDAPPAVFHIHSNTTLFDEVDDWVQLGGPEALIKKLNKEYVSTIAPSHRQLLERFSLHDMAFKVVGVGSVGTRCLVALLMDDQGKPLFMQIKEARDSVLAPYVKCKSPLQHQGRRVVDGQRMMQASSDIFLGWSTGPSGRHFYFRQLRDQKVSAQVDLYDTERLKGYARACGWALARAHARAGGMAAEVSGYMGKSDSMPTALAKYAMAYADQVDIDYEVFSKACRSGRLQARTEADYAADFSV
ncbi:DUF2252 domain-containing protein [Silvimonas amylolytica]|uniref:DUF2252 domain-containing protein n=1 Tax=Silvimonas amylolytica TaxID=449663 RepID=A0ABQ2PLR5_9NEIS|nr:DUF2252 domain-containing protein [Silvimonas amylolytica]GGP26547.1 hypothetical protein GCM10010971_23660 [Silvimonas amylolytica]